MRVVYSSHTSASRDRHELHNTLQMIPLGNELVDFHCIRMMQFSFFLKSSVSLDLSYIITNPISVFMHWQISVKYSGSFVKYHVTFIIIDYLNIVHLTSILYGLIMDTYPLWWFVISGWG